MVTDHLQPFQESSVSMGKVIAACQKFPSTIPYHWCLPAYLFWAWWSCSPVDDKYLNTIWSWLLCRGATNALSLPQAILPAEGPIFAKLELLKGETNRKNPTFDVLRMFVQGMQPNGHTSACVAPVMIFLKRAAGAGRIYLLRSSLYLRLRIV